MKQESPALLPLLRSNVQGEILAALFLDAGRELSISELARLAETQPSNAHKEVSRLLRAGLVLDRRVGRSRMIRADETNELFRPISEIITKTYGPRQAIARRLNRIPGIREAYIFGSWARRYHGEAGPSPRDIDVILVGEPDRREVNEAVFDLQEELGKEVGLVTVSPEEWKQRASGFLETVTSSPLVDVLEEHP